MACLPAPGHTLRWRHNGRDSVSNHQPHDCLLNRLFRRRSKKTSKLCVTGLCEGNSPGTGEFPAQMASNAENVSIWWRHHDLIQCWHTTIEVLWHLFHRVVYLNTQDINFQVKIDKIRKIPHASVSAYMQVLLWRVLNVLGFQSEYSCKSDEIRRFQTFKSS